MENIRLIYEQIETAKDHIPDEFANAALAFTTSSRAIAGQKTLGAEDPDVCTR